MITTNENVSETKIVKSMKLDPKIIRFREQIMLAEHLNSENELEQFFIEAVLTLKQTGHQYIRDKTTAKARETLYEQLIAYYRIPKATR